MKGICGSLEMNVMGCEKKVRLRSKIVRRRNQGVSVVGWVDVWGENRVVACMVGLVAAG